MADKHSNDDAASNLRFWFQQALVIATTVVVVFGIASFVNYREATSFANRSDRMAADQIAAECTESADRKVCADKVKRVARADQRSEYELSSQRMSASWTALMGVMAVFGIALSAVGVYLIWRTWDATQAAAESSRNTLLAYVAKERAFLKVEKHESYYDAVNEAHQLNVEVRNQGLSPATVTWVYCWSLPNQTSTIGEYDTCEVFEHRELVLSEDTVEIPMLSLSKEDEVITGLIKYRTLEGIEDAVPFTYFKIFRRGVTDEHKKELIRWHLHPSLPKWVKDHGS